MSAKQPSQKSGQLVVPGDKLGVIEEFVPDAGTFVKDGVIYSMIVGRTLLDLATRRVSVHPLTKEVDIPKVNSVVMGQVSNAQSDNANVRIFKVGDRQVSGVFVGVLHISDVQLRYVESMYDNVKGGDIIRARVISDKNQVYHLSTKEKELGVVYGFCSRCGTFLQPRRHDLQCPNCGNIESRKAAMDYGTGLQ